MKLTEDQFKQIISQNGMMKTQGIEADGLIDPAWYQAPDETMFVFELTPEDPVYHARLIAVLH